MTHVLPPNGGASRRDFLKLAGFSTAAIMLPGCGRGKAHEAVPFLRKPEGVTPGQSQFYATHVPCCESGCSVLVKVRDGRPIKVEGNPAHGLSQGGTCAAAQAQVLSLYDEQRLTRPMLRGMASDEDTVEKAVIEALRAAGTGVRLLTGSLHGPAKRAAVADFLGAFPGAKHIVFDAVSHSALLDAYEALVGVRIVPRYRFEHARAVVGVAADFLGTWLSPVASSRGYHQARSLEKGASFCHHTQFEAAVSLTGGSADRRVRTHPSDFVPVLAALCERVAKARGATVPWSESATPHVNAELLDQTARRLLDAPRGQALVVCGWNDPTAQQLTAYANHLLGADDPQADHRTVDLERPSRQVQSNDADMAALREDMAAGRVKALVIAGCNPVYALLDGEAFAKQLASVPFVVACAERMDETADHATAVCPVPHPLASWGDAEPVAGHLSVRQPTIAPLHGARPWFQRLAAWRGATQPAYDLVRESWKRDVFPRANARGTFTRWWHQVVHDGYVDVQPDAGAPLRVNPDALNVSVPASAPALAFVLTTKVGVGDGRHAHNPWLQELPDPVTKVSWQNTADLSPATAKKLGVEDGDLVRVSVGDASIDLPALVQPGQADDVVAVARGYGVKGTDRFADVGPDWIQATPTVEPGKTVGVRAEALARKGAVTVKRLGEHTTLARTQIYDRLEVPEHLAPAHGGTRPFVEETTWTAYQKDPRSGRHPSHHPKAELWPDDHPYKGHHWQLSVDLASCTGCAACVIACQSENNIPVVGKDEMARQRDMHWIRIDRYYQGDDEDLRIAHQPMMCQQCDNAPCETVCPVLATVHGEEGLNQQVYNRCVGTRYCANNCPYKVRRFNWFDYAKNGQLQNMALNPDVTIRSRGVMEKCTFCVQRIQEAKADVARTGGKALARDAVQTACMQVCPVDAIVFGDGNDPGSRVAKNARSPRAYRALEELNVRPSVSYLRRVRDREATSEPRHG